MMNNEDNIPSQQWNTSWVWVSPPWKIFLMSSWMFIPAFVNGNIIQSWRFLWWYRQREWGLNKPQLSVELIGLTGNWTTCSELCTFFRRALTVTKVAMLWRRHRKGLIHEVSGSSLPIWWFQSGSVIPKWWPLSTDDSTPKCDSQSKYQLSHIPVESPFWCCKKAGIILATSAMRRPTSSWSQRVSGKFWVVARSFLQSGHLIFVGNDNVGEKSESLMRLDPCSHARLAGVHTKERRMTPKHQELRILYRYL